MSEVVILFGDQRFWEGGYTKDHCFLGVFEDVESAKACQHWFCDHYNFHYETWKVEKVESIHEEDE
jgi:hypothetical protein